MPPPTALGPLLGFDAAMSGAFHLERREAALLEPETRFGLFADSGYGSGGGGRSSLMGDLFVQGNPPADGAAVQAAATRHSVIDALRQGTVFVQVQSVSGANMPRLNTLSLLPARAEAAFQAVLPLDRWSEWMPRNIFSRGTSAGPGALYHEAKVDAGAGGTFHYRARMTHGAIDGGFQIRWDITPDSRIDPEKKHKGLRRNSGTWTFVPVPGSPDETLMAYQILVDPDVSSILMVPLKPILTAITLGEFDEVIRAIANRSADPSWTRRSPANPSGKNYRIQKTA